ncbi:hypothetical protein [Micromonospora sp. NPDC049282]|uniref:hypothetical protein n=1 Tax=Micromonospora sp. NPDC049282 TaxID=3364269 RepID=UPI0037231276
MSHVTGAASPPRLAIGVTSRNAVDATIASAARHRQRLMLIASRAQIDGPEFGGGYVEGWTSEDLVEYVRSRDAPGRVTVCRDHGGPWQHVAESAAGPDESEAMASSLRSFQRDIAAGFEVLHIDTSRDHHPPAARGAAVRRLVTLYQQCHEFARSRGRTVHFEVGVEEQSTAVGDVSGFRAVLTELTDRLTALSLPRPLFAVAQTGTRVVETENRGALVDDPRAVGQAIRGLAEVCRQAGVGLKAHNVDYLRDAALRTMLDNGVTALNVAPEFGVTETRAYLDLLDILGLTRQREAFLELAYGSGAWRKWLGSPSAADDLQRAVLAGHYVFGTDRFRELKAEVESVCAARGLTVDGWLRSALERAMGRYVRVLDPAVRERESVGLR